MEEEEWPVKGACSEKVEPAEGVRPGERESLAEGVKQGEKGGPEEETRPEKVDPSVVAEPEEREDHEEMKQGEESVGPAKEVRPEKPAEESAEEAGSVEGEWPVQEAWSEKVGSADEARPAEEGSLAEVVRLEMGPV